MSSFFDGHIASIREDIVEDLEEITRYIKLVALPAHYAETSVVKRAERVAAYLEAYKANEEKV